MKQPIKISVILPAYNHENYIAKTFESILSQTFTNYEVVVIDDGSSDNTWEIIEKYAKADSRIRAYRHENQGTVKTQEKALALAVGEWITFCGSDDSFPEGAFSALMEKTDGADVVIGAHYYVNDLGECNKISLPKTKNHVMQLYFTGALWGKAFRKDFLLENNVSYPELLLEEDTVFLAQVVAGNPRYAYTQKPTYNYWEHNLAGISLSRKITPELFLHRVKGKEMALNKLWEVGYNSECEYYFEVYSDQLLSYLLMMQGMQEADYCFSRFKQFVFMRNWTGKEKLFSYMFHCDYKSFAALDFYAYYNQVLQIKPENYVLERFKAGRIGCKYILKYFAAWAAYKLKRIK